MFSLFKKVLIFIWKTLSFIREITLNFLFLIILFGVIFVIYFSNNGESIPQNGVLVLDIKGSIVNRITTDENLYKLAQKLNADNNINFENSLFDLTDKINQATNDQNIKGIVLKLDEFTGTDLPSLNFLAKYLKKFKESGKPIYAVGNYFDQKRYYLASLADKIYLINQGSTSLYGFSAQNLYFKSLLDSLKVNIHVFRVGTYKSAVEPYLRDDMSQPAKENTTRWLTAMWQNYLVDAAENRKIQADKLVPSPAIMLERLKYANGSLSDYAKENGIVDEVLSSYQADKQLDKLFDNADQLSIYDYKLTNQSELKTSIHSKIAVVTIDGTITTGESSNNSVGSDTIAKQLRSIGEDEAIKALVILINSPGGGVYASEVIRSEIEALRKKSIPVVISMSGMAASGGYWISTESDYIIANKNTITGSIGIFGIIPTFEDSLHQFGVHTDGVSTSPLANTSITQDISDEMNQLTQMNIENGYHHFVSLVANSRHINYDAVDNIAQGQVWLGQEAKEIGLVDQLGDFDDAIAKAASLANLDNYIIDWQEPENTSLLNQIFNDYSALLPKPALEIFYQKLYVSTPLQHHLSFLSLANDPRSAYVYCLTCIDILK